MSKYINSKEAVLSPLLLWQETPTQVAVQETYVVKEYPQSSIFNEGPINFSLSPQPNGMLTSVDIVTKFKLTKAGDTSTTSRYINTGIINNFASSLWELVEVRLDDRVDIMQSMRNAYAYQTFFNNSLNTESNHADFLFSEEIFMMDEGFSKEDAEDTKLFTLATSTIARKLNEEIFELENGDTELDDYDYAKKLKALKERLENSSDYYTTTNTKNPAAGKRAYRVNNLKSTIVNTKLQCPLLTTSKCLPTNMKIRISLSKNTDDFLLHTDSTITNVLIEDVHLDVTYFRPIDKILRHIEEHLMKEPIPYFITKPEISIKPITHSSRIIRITNLFQDKMPKQAVFCLQKSADFNGKPNTSPFIFIPFSKFQIFVNGKPYFTDPLEADSYEVAKVESSDNTRWQNLGDFYSQLYKTLGKDMQGDCLINSSNFHLNFMAAVSFTADRSTTSAGYLNLQQSNSASLEIDMGYDDDIPEDMIMVIYALFDRQIKIDSNRAVTIID